VRKRKFFLVSGRMADPVVCPKCGRTVYGWVKSWMLKEGKMMVMYRCPGCGEMFRRIIKTSE